MASAYIAAASSRCPFDLALAELDLIKFVGGERPDVLAAAEDARRTFESIGSPALLRRLDETLGLPVA